MSLQYHHQTCPCSSHSPEQRSNSPASCPPCPENNLMRKYIHPSLARNIPGHSIYSINMSLRVTKNNRHIGNIFPLSAVRNRWENIKLINFWSLEIVLLAEKFSSYELCEMWKVPAMCNINLALCKSFCITCDCSSPFYNASSSRGSLIVIKSFLKNHHEL